MNTYTTQQQYGDLSTGQRGARLVAGMVLILGAMFYQGAFSTVAALPLIAVYPVITGLIGVDPIYLLWQKYFGSHTEFTLFSRGLLITTAAVLIGSVMASEGELGWRGIFALVAVYPVLAAIIGKDPLNGFVSYSKDNVVPLRTQPNQQPTSVRKAA